MSELNHLDATAQAELVSSGQVSPAELVDAAIAQADAVNGSLNAIIHPRYDKARAEARGELPNGAFRGVPLVLKDLGAMLGGEPYHLGTRFLKNAGYIAPHDSFLTQRFKKAGFVVIGRTNTPEFGSTITTEPLAHGPSRNPWNLEHSTGGSSGGSAAAVASRIVAVGHANDGGGSIRIPASECGLVGLKPSRARVSIGPDLGETWMAATIDGCVTRSVRDTAAVLDVISGYETGDPNTAPPPSRPYAQEVGAAPGTLRIGLLDNPGRAKETLGAFDHEESRASVAAVAKVLTDLGHEVEIAHPVAIDEPEFGDTFAGIVAACTRADVAFFEQMLGRTLGEGDLEDDNLFMNEMGRAMSAEQYLTSVSWMHAWSRRMIEWWLPRDGSRGFDILCTPTLAGPPPKLGWLRGPDGGTNLRKIMAYTAQFNVTGQPAVSLPLHWSRDGLPMGVQFVGAPFREDVLIRLASQLEQAMPWAHRIPSVA